ncbi:MAG: trypsin-like peptidase domain-containing protein [Candidatus Spechtbacteria bacterium]|nr:trypsin-like peptidase domain-containing protein [Candidatus Spechtbacteria bacterium]
MVHFLSKLTFTVVVGGIGGVLFIEAALPYLQRHGLVQKIPLLQKMGTETTIIERTEKIIIEENSALEQAIARSKQSIIAVQALDASGKQVAYASGLVLTNDGMVIVPSTVVKQESKNYLVRGARDWFNADLRGIDIKTGLAIFRAVDLHLSPAAFVDEKDIVLGKRVFALSMPQENVQHVEGGMITTIGPDAQKYDTSIRLLLRGYDGSAVFSLDNKVLGIGRFANENETNLVSSKDIESFLRKTLAQRVSLEAISLTRRASASSTGGR